jgi:hypothetical protein
MEKIKPFLHSKLSPLFFPIVCLNVRIRKPTNFADPSFSLPAAERQKMDQSSGSLDSYARNYGSNQSVAMSHLCAKSYLRTQIRSAISANQAL